MNILITGANGFIGKNLCEKLCAENNVIGIGNHDCQIKGVEYHKIDVLNSNAINELFEKKQFDKVIHLAGVTYHNDIVNQKKMSLETSFLGTQNLITAFNKYCSGGLFIYSSTGKIYGGGKYQPIDENTPPNPVNALGKQKRMTEELIDYYSQENISNKFVIMRIFNIYGAGQRPTFVIPYIIEQLKQSDNISLGNINDARDYLHINDLVDCFDSILKRYKSDKSLEIFNIGSGKAFSVEQILSIIKEKTGRNITVSIDKTKLRYDETSIEYADISKIYQAVGWKPQIKLENALTDLLKQENLL